MNELIELTVDCPECGDMIVIKVRSIAQVGDILKPCPACRVLTAAA